MSVPETSGTPDSTLPCLEVNKDPASSVGKETPETKMYTLHREVNITKGSASPFSKNVSVFYANPGKKLTYASLAHKGQVNTVGWDAKLEGMTQEMLPVREALVQEAGGRNLTVMQVKYCHVPTRDFPVMVVCTTCGCGIYEWNGSKMLHWYSLPKPNEGDSLSYCKGIDTSGHYVIIGTSMGDLVAFSIRDEVKLKTSLKSHAKAIVDVGGNGERVASADVDGAVVIWDASFKVVRTMATEQPISCIALYRDVILAATVLGGIFLYDANTGQLKCEVAAHARAINALDVLQSSGLVLTASEDSFVRVWKVTAAPSLEIDCLFSEAVPNVPHSGAVFADSEGGSFVCTGFDYATAFYFKKKS